MKVHCRQLFINKDGVAGGSGGGGGDKKKEKEMERKTFSRGLCGVEDRLLFFSPCHMAVMVERGGACCSRAAVFQVLLSNWQFCEQ